MLKKIIFSTLLLSSLVACQNTATVHQEKEKHDHAKHEQEEKKGDGIHFGETISPDGAISVNDGIAKLIAAKDLKVVTAMGDATKKGLEDIKIEGKVKSVCQAKGCWMRITTDDKQEVFVKFKDYGFFVPMDLAGKSVVLQGNLYADTTSVDDLQHFLSEDEEFMKKDKATQEKELAAIKEPKIGYGAYAKGVVIK